MRGWKQITRWRTQSNRPPNSGRVEDVVALRPGVNRGGVLHPLRSAATEYRSFGQNFEPGNIRRFAVVFPADQARNRISVLHARAFEKPVLLIDAPPVSHPVKRKSRA